jgi:hypothetical protein
VLKIPLFVVYTLSEGRIVRLKGARAGEPRLAAD